MISETYNTIVTSYMLRQSTVMNVLEVIDRVARVPQNVNAPSYTRAETYRLLILKHEFSTEVLEVVLRVNALLPSGVPATSENMRPYLDFVLEREKGYIHDEQVDAGFTIYAIRREEILAKTP